MYRSLRMRVTHLSLSRYRQGCGLGVDDLLVAMTLAVTSAASTVPNSSELNAGFWVLERQRELSTSCTALWKELSGYSSTSEAETALLSYKSLCNRSFRQPIWAVAENYRFEPAFVECRKLINDIGEMTNIQVIVEGSMNNSNPYFSSSWRRNFTGGFILDMGVHFIAGLRMLAGCEIATVSAIGRHVNTNLPPPDNLCSLFQLENGCPGVFVMAVSSPSPKIYWRVNGTKATVQIERGVENGRHGYTVLFYTADGLCRRAFHPFSGVNEELKAFLHDIKHATNKNSTTKHEAEPRSSYLEGVRDVAVLEAMLESSTKNGANIHVKSF